MTYTLNGLKLRAGDIICNADGTETSFEGRVWQLIGSLVPGEVTHIVMYVGPGPRFVEAGPFGVILFEMPADQWEPDAVKHARGLLDTFVGIVSPYKMMGVSGKEETKLRKQIARYCLNQVGKPYNFDFFNPETEDRFYCSQLAYKAFLPHGLNLHTGAGIPPLPGFSRAIFPQEIWQGNVGQKHRAA